MKALILPDFGPDNPYQHLLAAELETQGVSPILVKELRDTIAILLTGWRQRDLVVHLHWTHRYALGDSLAQTVLKAARFLAWLSMVWLLRLPLVWTIHNLRDHEKRAPRVDRLVNRFVARIARVLIVHSPSSVALAAQALGVPPERFTVIPHGNYIDVYGPRIPRLAARRQLGLPENAFVFANIGYLRPYKRIDQLLRAFQAMTSEATLVIAGLPYDDRLRGQIEQLASGSRPVILRLEYNSHRDVGTLLSAANAFVLSSERFFTSGSVILAMSYGLPLVAPNLPFVRDVVDLEEAALFDPSTSGSLSRALDEARHRFNGSIANRQLERAKSSSWQSVADAHIYHYRSAMADRGKHKRRLR